MSDIIRREQAIKAMQESEFGYTFEVGEAIEAVRAIPAVETERIGKMSEDLISRKAMIRAVDNLGEDYISYYKLLLLIGRMPSAEPKIIRCKDCKHWKQQINYQGTPLSFGFCESEDMWRLLYGETTEVAHIDTDDNHYCGFAEKRNNDS